MRQMFTITATALLCLLPLLGAAAGAATNYAYTSYYQQMAHVQFGLRRLSQDSGRPREELVAQLRQRLLQR